MTSQQIGQLFSEQGACGWGSISWSALRPYLTGDKWRQLESSSAPPTGVMIAAFPYFAGLERGNISLYARGMDYHVVVRKRLDNISQRLGARHPEHLFLTAVDASPLPEKVIALLSGLGRLGQNTLIIHPHYGSYVFFGTILTNLPMDFPDSAPLRTCRACGNCVKYCPGGALSKKGLDKTKCLSHLTQHNSFLSAVQSHAIAEHSYVWGCDICQEVCPENKDVALSPLSEFRKNLIPNLSSAGFESMTNHKLKSLYPNRAFTWRGAGVLRRNFTLQWFLMSDTKGDL